MRSGRRAATGAGMTPAQAAMRLLDQVVDGGLCAHCGRPTGVTDQTSDMPLAMLLCWYVFDPETGGSAAAARHGKQFGIDREGNPVGRNDPCPCGSGQKFERCHGA
jgi:hypothetical protein